MFIGLHYLVPCGSHHINELMVIHLTIIIIALIPVIMSIVILVLLSLIHI